MKFNKQTKILLQLMLVLLINPISSNNPNTNIFLPQEQQSNINNSLISFNNPSINTLRPHSIQANNSKLKSARKKGISVISYAIKRKQDRFTQGRMEKFFNNMEVIKELGKGSFGSVFQVKHYNKLYAVKLIRVANSYERRMIENEINILILFEDNPHIVQIVAWNQNYNRYRIAYDLAEKDLKAEIKEYNGKLPKDKIKVNIICNIY